MNKRPPIQDPDETGLYLWAEFNLPAEARRHLNAALSPLARGCLRDTGPAPSRSARAAECRSPMIGEPFGGGAGPLPA